MWLSYSLTLAKFQDGGLAMSSDVLHHFRLLQCEFLGCMKLKDSAQGNVTHMTSHRKFVSPTAAKTTLIFTSESKLPYKCEAPTTFSLEASLWWFYLVWFLPQRWEFSAYVHFGADFLQERCALPKLVTYFSLVLRCVMNCTWPYMV